MPTVSITSFYVQDAEGGEGFTAGNAVRIWAQCTSEHDAAVTVDGSFSLSTGENGADRIQLEPGASEWMSWQSSGLDAGGYDAEITIGGEVDMTSQMFDQSGMSFAVTAAPAAGPGSPYVEIDALALQPHSNVDHDEGTAWSDDAVRASAHVVNHGQATGSIDVTIWCSDGQSTSQTVELGEGADEWYVLELQPLAAGTHTVSAAVSWEGEDSSQILSQMDRELTVSERGEGWIEANVQFIVNDYKGEPMRDHRIFSRFVGMDGTDYYGGETVEASENDSGVVTSSGIYVQREGTVQIMAVSEGDPGPLLEGQVHYQLAEGDTNLAFTVSQDRTERTYNAHSAEEVGEAVSAEFSTGVNIEIIEVGGSVATEQSRSRTYGEAVEWKVRVGLTNLVVEQTS